MTTIDRLSADDVLMLAFDARWPQDVGALMVLDGTPLLDATSGVRIDDVRRAMTARLDLVPRFRQRLTIPPWGRGGPLWLDCLNFDIARHVQVLPLAAGAGERELLAMVERLRSRRLDMARPLWEMWFLPGLPERRVGLFLRIHHAIGDGRAAMSMLSALFDQAPEVAARPAEPWRPTPAPRPSDLVGDTILRYLRGLAGMASRVLDARGACRRMRAAWPAVRELLAEEPGDETSLDLIVGPGRRTALVRSATGEVRRIARAHAATPNDVLLSVTAAGLRALFRARREPIDGVTVRIYVPVSLRRTLHGAVHGNEISQMVVPLPIGVADPGERLRRIAAETARRKARSRSSVSTLFRGRLLNRMLLRVMSRQKVNVTTGNVPGPRRPRYLAGAPVLEMFPFLNLIGWVSLGIGVITYAGRFSIAIIADAASYPDLEVLAAGMREELAVLAAAAAAQGVSQVQPAAAEAVAAGSA